MSSPSCLLIRRAQILLPDGNFLVGDVQIRDRQIVQVAAEISSANEGTTTREIDAEGLTLLPGVIDPQVHFREPGLEYKEDFLLVVACAKGGVTSFLENAQHSPSNYDSVGSR
jgi:dihydroorotase